MGSGCYSAGRHEVVLLLTKHVGYDYVEKWIVVRFALL